MRLENYIMEQDINTASVADIFVEQAQAEMNVIASIVESYTKDVTMEQFIQEGAIKENTRAIYLETLYEERMKAVKDIAEYKIENGLEVLDSSREKTMLEKNLLKISNVELKKYYHHVLTGFLDASKEMQKEIIAKK